MISRINNRLVQPIICIAHPAIKYVGNVTEKLLTLAGIIEDCDQTACLENLQFIQHIIKQKTNSINAEELNQIKKIKHALNYNSRLQKDLSELSDEELRLYLCHTYVESSHVLEPLIAYNIKDHLTKMDNPDSDDNTNMLNAYAYMIAFANDVFSKKMTENLPKKIERTILALYSILLTGNEKNINEIAEFQRTKFCIYSDEIDNGEVILDEMNERRNFRKIIDLGYSNNITFHIRHDRKGIGFIVNNYERSTLKDEVFARLSSYKNERQILKQKKMIKTQRCLKEISLNLANAILTRNKKAIFKITTDLMYLHLFPNANGRVSQVIRDSLNIAMGLHPYKALTHMSQYMYVVTQPNEDHMLFMRKHNAVILKKIKEGHAADLKSRKVTNSFIESYKNTDNKQIAKDIQNYIHHVAY